MIKIGGSVLDAEFESGHAVIGQLVAPLKELQQNFDVFITPEKADTIHFSTTRFKLVRIDTIEIKRP